ncbi:hypothetical protein [Sulfurifustis variabilis]|uniref:hypothetical protein n=1 Tax=Sulfurifustis variabilis TaxID=1675686 RepID=UPI000BBB3EE3|nr:hypothetical protein [Sulfurifustis variabilis]
MSIKGIGLGLLAAFVLAIPLDLLFGYYLSAVYDELAPGVNFANQAEADAFAARVMGHPLMIAFAILATLLTSGSPDTSRRLSPTAPSFSIRRSSARFFRRSHSWNGTSRRNFRICSAR